MMGKTDRPLDVLTVGDLMIDFTSLGVSENGRQIFERNPGGAPSNVASQVAGLGGKSAFIGAVGKDEHGEYLIRTMKDLGIDVSGIRISPTTATRITFVYLDGDNDRHFSTYKSPRADYDLPEDEHYYQLADQAQIFHLASTALFGEPVSGTAAKLLRYARERGKLISYDPNWNVVLGFDPAQKKVMMDTFHKVDILKISREEYDYFIGEKDLRKGSDKLLDMGIRLLAVTMGAGGCYYRTRSCEGYEASWQVSVRDTTGSGDSFMGGLLYRISHAGKSLESFGQEELSDIIRFANACGSTCATRTGSLLAMPDLDEVRRTMEQCAQYPDNTAR